MPVLRSIDVLRRAAAAAGGLKRGQTRNLQNVRKILALGAGAGAAQWAKKACPSGDVQLQRTAVHRQSDPMRTAVFSRSLPKYCFLYAGVT